MAETDANFVVVDPEDELRIYIVVRRDIGDIISKPKFGVQCAHATLSVWAACVQNDPVRAWRYFQAAQPKIVLQVKDAKALLDLHAKARQARFFAEPIVDAGRTEFSEPTLTSIALGPIWFKAEGQPLLKRVRLYQDTKPIEPLIATL